MSGPAQHRRRLIHGLAGRHEDLYHHSPSFRAQIDGLASLLPAMIDGLAATAEDADRAHLARMKVLKKGPLLTPEQARKEFPEIFANTPVGDTP